MVQVRTKLTFVCRLSVNKLTTCGLEAARKDAASTFSIPCIVYCCVNPLIVELVSRISNLFFAFLPNMEFTCILMPLASRSLRASVLPVYYFRSTWQIYLLQI